MVYEKELIDFLKKYKVVRFVRFSCGIIYNAKRMSRQKIMQNIYTVQYFVFYILPLVIFVKKVVYRREMMGEYLKIDWWEWRY